MSPNLILLEILRRSQLFQLSSWLSIHQSFPDVFTAYMMLWWWLPWFICSVRLCSPFWEQLSMWILSWIHSAQHSVQHALGTLQMPSYWLCAITKENTGFQHSVLTLTWGKSEGVDSFWYKCIRGLVGPQLEIHQIAIERGSVVTSANLFRGNSQRLSKTRHG